MKKYFFLAVIPVAVLILFHPVLFTYFSQDDFFHFKVSLTDGSFTQFINLFGYHPFAERGIAFYRPVFREALFNLFYVSFGLNPYPFRILQFAILILNSFLIFRLILGVFRDKHLAFFVAFFYSISSAQISPLFYLAGGIQVLGTTCFSLVSLIYWRKYLINQKIHYGVFSFVGLLFALGTHELSAITSFLIVGLSVITVGFIKTLHYLKYFLFLILILTVHFYLEWKLIGYSSTEQQYKILVNPKTILNSYTWYTGWALGLPEMLIDFVFPGFKLNPDLMRYWGNYYRIIFLSFFVSTGLIIASLSYVIIKNKKIIPSATDLFFLFWFFSGLIPIIFLPLHKSTQYLELSLIPFWTIIGLLILKTYNLIKHKKIVLAKIYLFFFILSLLVLSVSSIMLERTTYWAAQRGKYAEQLIKQITYAYPSLPKGSVIYIENDPNYPFIAKEWGSSSKQAAFILNNNDALRLIYKDQTLKVYYEDIEKPSTDDYSNKKIYNITAKIF